MSPVTHNRRDGYDLYPDDSHTPITCTVISLQHIAKHLGVALATVKVWAYQRTIGDPPRFILPEADFDRYFDCGVCDHYHQGWYGCNIQMWARIPDGNGKERRWTGPDYIKIHESMELEAGQRPPETERLVREATLLNPFVPPAV